MTSRKGRILSKDAERWFENTYSVTVERGGFCIVKRGKKVHTMRRKWIGVLQFAKNQYAVHCKKGMS